MNENKISSNSNSIETNTNELGTTNVSTTSYAGGIGESNETQKSSKRVGVLVAILIILVVALIGVIFLHEYKGSQNTFKVLVDNAFDYLEANTVDYKTASGTFSLKVNGTSNDEEVSKIFEILNKVDLSGSYNIDYENKIINMDIKSNYEEKELINANIVMEDEKGYIYLDNIYDKYIKMDMDDYDSLFENNQEDYKVILSSIHSSLINSLKDEYFTKTTDTIDGHKVDKTTLVLDKTTLENIKNDFVNALVDDEEFKESLAKVSDMDINEIDEYLNDALDEEIDDDFEEVDISIYTSNTEFVKFEVNNSTNSIITVTKNNDDYNYEIKSEDINYKGTISISKDNDKTTYVVSFSDEDNNNRVEATITSSVNYNTNVDKKDVSNSVYYDDITDVELQDIYSKLMDQEGLVNFSTDISSLYSTDYDYDDLY